MHKLIYFFIAMTILIATSAYPDSINIPGCNGEITGPKKLEILFPGASMGVYTCYHDLENDGNADIALIYVYNKNDKTFELIRVMRMMEYYDLLDKERERE